MHKVWQALRSLAGGWFLPACLVLTLQLAGSRALSLEEGNPGTPHLHALPLELGNWKAHGEKTLDKGLLDTLRPDQYLLRDYADETSGASINVFVAYFASLQTEYGPHSPRICLPGAGWLIRSSKVAPVQVPGRPADIAINEYVMEKASDRILVLYWYQNDRNVWAEEFWAKLALLPDLLRYRRSDASLIRLITPISHGAPGKELTDCIGFARLMFPSLTASLRRTR
jgi:EpsI family protein